MGIYRRGLQGGAASSTCPGAARNRIANPTGLVADYNFTIRCEMDLKGVGVKKVYATRNSPHRPPTLWRIFCRLSVRTERDFPYFLGRFLASRHSSSLSLFPTFFALFSFAKALGEIQFRAQRFFSHLWSLLTRFEINANGARSLLLVRFPYWSPFKGYLAGQ